MPRTKNKGAAANTKLETAIREARRQQREQIDHSSNDYELPGHWFEEAHQPIELPFRPLPTFQASKEVVAEERRQNMQAETEPSVSTSKGKMTESEPAESSNSKGPSGVPDGDWVELPKAEQKHIIAEEPDMAEYKMVYNQQPGTRALLLRFPNRRPDQPYCARFGQKPLELRIKSKFGHVELDIPVDIHENWDHEKAIEYQQAMRKSTVLQHGGSYGLAGGLGTTAKSAPADKSGDSSRATGPSKETLLANIDDANNKGHVMNKITLAGRIFPPDNTAPRYLFGTFKDGKHATELNSLST